MARLFQWKDGTRTLLEDEESYLISNRDEPLRMEVRVRGKSLDVLLNGKQALAASATDDLRGNVGFLVSGSSQFKGALQISNFRVGPLPVEAALSAVGLEDLDRERERRISLAMAEAARHIELARPEAAATALRAARDDALALNTKTLRNALVAAIDTSLAKADPLCARRKKAFATAAESQRALAEAYAERGLLRAAAVAATMEALDPDGQGATAAEFRRRADAGASDPGGSADGGTARR